MISTRTSEETNARVAVLFAPHVVAVIDIFRALGDFEDHYDIATLDDLEASLARGMSPDIAKSIVSDALLLAFSLRRERREPLAFAPVRSRRGTLDEYRLLALIAAGYWNEPDLAAQAASALNIVHHKPALSLASDIAKRLDAAGVVIDAPDSRLVSAASAAPSVEVERDLILTSDLKLTFDV
jgi:hypothetical protein